MRERSPSFMILCTRTVCLLSTQMRCARRALLAFASACVDALQQPPLQYRVALLLATILAFLLGWPLWRSTLPHTSFALIWQ